MDALFAQKKIDFMLEIGSFMGGSARRWLRSDAEMRIVCVDPWGNNVGYMNLLSKADWAIKLASKERLEHYRDLVERHGTFAVVQNNLFEYRDRVVMIRDTVPDVFGRIGGMLRPNLIFIDATKVREEFWPTHEAFPDAIIAGDDWSWAESPGNFPVRKYVEEIAEARGGRIYGDRQTFVISEPQHGLRFDEKYQYHWK